MDNIYYWIGFGIFYLAGIFGSLFMAIMIIIWTINFVSSRFAVFGYIFKYAYYQKEFHKWLQENHPDSPEENNLIVPESKTENHE